MEVDLKVSVFVRSDCCFVVAVLGISVQGYYSHRDEIILFHSDLKQYGIPEFVLWHNPAHLYSEWCHLNFMRFIPRYNFCLIFCSLKKYFIVLFSSLVTYEISMVTVADKQRPEKVICRMGWDGMALEFF